MMYPDPIEPAITISDYLRVQTMEVATEVVTWASGQATPPSRPRLRFPLPPVGLCSRIYIDVDGGSATAFDFTAGGGTGTVAADGQGPWGIVEGIEVRVNGGAGFYDVSGFGTYLLNAAEEPHAFPQDAPGTVYTTAPTDVASRIFDYPVAADGRPRFGFEVPFSLSPGQPLGMVLLGNDQTNVELGLRLGALDRYAVLAGGASATLSLSFTVTMEYFDVPERGAFDAYARPMLQWAHWNVENRQDITSTGPAANIVKLDNHDSILQVIHVPIIDSKVNTDAVDRLAFVLNRTTQLESHKASTHLRRQRRALGKDLPAFVWHFFSTRTLRDAIRADSYTEIRSQLDLVAGTALGTGAHIKTIEKKLVDLGAPPIGAF